MCEAVLLSGCSVDPFGMSLVAGLAAIWFVAWYYSGQQRVKRQLRAARAWKIGELPESTPGRVIGKAEALGEVMTGPLTGRPCVCYVAKVEQRGRGSDRWRTIIEESRGVNFRLVDDTGHAIIDPTDAKIALTFDRNRWSGISQDPTELEEAFLAKHGHGSKGWVFNKSLRYHEAVIEIGETVAVLGSGVREFDPTAPPPENYRGSPPTRLRLTSSARYPLVISDIPATTVTS
ncbi:MAG TPA: GIDE domain-containing protein [Kofleriaceae bacterium]|nr:GIDE domain-containing protein [Kofleriaceae bacterium]